MGVLEWRCAVSLRKSPTLTPALLASNRLNAKKSTGPRTARGKAWSRLNRFHHGMRSPEYLSFAEALHYAPPCQVEATAKALLSSRQIQSRLFLEYAELCVQVEIEICAESRWKRLHPR